MERFSHPNCGRIYFNTKVFNKMYERIRNGPWIKIVIVQPFLYSMRKRTTGIDHNLAKAIVILVPMAFKHLTANPYNLLRPIIEQSFHIVPRSGVRIRMNFTFFVMDMVQHLHVTSPARA